MIGLQHPFFDVLKSPLPVATPATVATATRPWMKMSQVSQLSRADKTKSLRPAMRSVATVAGPKVENRIGSTPVAALPAAWKARAALLEACGLPREWAEPFALRLVGPPPGDFDDSYWSRLLPGANIFADEWARRAHAIGWTAKEVFGLDDIKPAARHDVKGIAWVLADGAQVLALDEHGADIKTTQASRMRFYRCPQLKLVDNRELCCKRT